MKYLLIVAAVLFCGCEPHLDSSGTQGKEAKLTENQQAIHLKTTPPPKLSDSLERKNLTKRLTLFNDPNKVSYIYLIEYGKVMAFYTIKGDILLHFVEILLHSGSPARLVLHPLHITECPRLIR